jgi:hypothetical protein
MNLSIIAISFCSGKYNAFYPIRQIYMEFSELIPKIPTKFSESIPQNHIKFGELIPQI